jgi:hypothetical protein
MVRAIQQATNIFIMRAVVTLIHRYCKNELDQTLILKWQWYKLHLDYTIAFFGSCVWRKFTWERRTHLICPSDSPTEISYR